jgi:hypothetical protein
MNAGIINIQKSDANLLGGTLQLSGNLPVNGTTPAQLRLNGANLKIEQLLRAAKPNEPPRYAGDVTLSINYDAPLGDWNTKAAGKGALELRNGKIDGIPILGKILSFVGNSLKLALTLGKNKPSDSADANFTFAGNTIRVDELKGSAGTLAFRATGTVGFDQKLALRLNAGPLETLQAALGPLGKAWATVTDAMAAYRISGTLAKPEITVEIGR